MIEPSTFNEPAKPAALVSGDRSMRVLESVVALIALFAAIALAVLPD